MGPEQEEEIMADEETTTTEETTSTETRPPILAVDLDGTIIDEDTEELIPGALDALRKLQKIGWKIVIWTARGDAPDYVPKLVKRLGIPCDDINENIKGLADKSRKIYFDFSCMHS